MTVAALVMTDGRDDLLDRTLKAWPYLDLLVERWIHDDSGDDAHRQNLRDELEADWLHVGQGPRRGFGGAIAHAWQHLRGSSSARYVLHLEDDFVPAIEAHVMAKHLAAMVEVMDRNPHIAQMALRRQPWNDAERVAGGVVELHPDDYAEVTDGQHAWLEHRLFFTTNPSLYRLSLCQRGWPTGPHSEGRFGIDLFASDPSVRCAYWGARDSGVWVEHIGMQRVGRGY